MSTAPDQETPQASMDSKDTCSLDELTAFALKECPSAFKIIADPNLYRFQFMSVMTKFGTHDVSELLHIAHWGPKARHDIPVWAGVQEGNVRYYYGKPGMRVKAVYAPFPEGSSNICDHITPFQFVAPSDWPRERSANTKAKEAARRRLALLVAFASLLTGRIGQIVDTNHGDLLHEFKDMCEVIQKYKNIKEAEDERNSRLEWTMQYKATKRIDKATPGMDSGTTSTTSTPIKSVACNSNTILSVSDDEDVAETIGSAANARKRRKHSSWQTDILTSALNSNKVAEPSKKMMELLVAVTEQCKTELLGVWAQEQYGEKIEILERQLAEKEKESEEWKSKFLKLEAKLTDGTSEQTELLRISYGDRSGEIVPLWAGLQNGSINYYAGHRATGVRAIGLLPRDGSEISYYLSPFRFVAGKNSPIAKDHATRGLLKDLASFAFLLTGRTGQIDLISLNFPDALKGFKAGCDRIHQYSILQKDKNDSTPVDLSLSDDAESELTSAAYDICGTDAEAEYQGRGASTSTINSVSSEESLDTEEDQGTYALSSIAEILTISTETSAPKTQKLPHTQSNVPTASISAKTPAPSDEVQALLNAVGEQYKKELQDNWARQKKALRHNNYTLVKQLKDNKKQLKDNKKRLHSNKTKLYDTEKKLSEKEQECEEWKAKFLKLQAGVGDLMNID